MANARIVVSGVSKVFGAQPEAALALMRQGLGREAVLERTGAVVALDDVTFSVDEGEILTVMGLSGSGKSTTLRCLNRLIDPTVGSVQVDGVEVTTLSTRDLRQFRRKTFGMVFQHFALLPNRTILGNVEFGLEVQGVPAATRREKAMAAIEVVGLKGWEAKVPGQLSGGMRQRAGLARALAADADILLMDEAFSALDPLIRREMQAELGNLQRRLNKTIVFVSHDLDEAVALGGRIVLMKDGAIVQCGTAEDFLMRPATDYVRRFVEHIDVASVLTAGRLADPAAIALTTAMTVTDAKVATVGCTMGGWFVADEGGRLAGVLERESLVLAKGYESVPSLMRPVEAPVRADETLKSVLPKLASSRDGLAVVASDDRFVGRLTTRSAIAAMAGAEHRRGAVLDGPGEDPSWIGKGTGASRNFPSTTSPTAASPGSRPTVPA